MGNKTFYGDGLYEFYFSFVAILGVLPAVLNRLGTDINDFGIYKNALHTVRKKNFVP